MDPHLASLQDQLFHQGMDIKHVQAIQTMHADRLLKLEKKQADDAALKSVWTSPFPSVLTGTPQQGPMHTPSANVFDDFDDEHCQSLLGSLHLDEESVPRRGASRANSVRFDVSAIQGSSWGHASRPSSDFASGRPHSAFGRSHSMERTMSHKSEGRHSSAGHSIHSTHSASGRTSSLGLNNHFAIGDPDDDAPYDMPAPPPGLFVLGTVPTIIRCWLNEDFSHSALLYAVVCTGSQKSTVDHHLLKEIGLLDQVQKDGSGNSYIRLLVYLPEAMVTQPTSRPCSPGPQLPTLTVNFDVTDVDSSKSPNKKLIRVFLGSDTLRAHNADLLLSKNRMELYDDDRNKLSVPFVRPEDDSVFKNIVTTHVREKYSLKGTAAPFTPAEKRSAPGSQSQSFENEPTTPGAGEGSSRGRSPPKSASVAENTAPEPSTEAPYTLLKLKDPLEGAKLAIDTKAVMNGTHGEPGSATETKPKFLHVKSPTSAVFHTENRDSASAGGIWSSWRSGGAPSALKDEDPVKEGTSTSGYNKPGRGTRGMKVLKPSKALPTTGRSVSSGAGMGMGMGMGVGSGNGTRTGHSYEPPPQSPLFDDLGSARRKSGGAEGGGGASLRWDAKKSVEAAQQEEDEPKKQIKLISGSKTSNPIGTASAFSWMKPGNTKSSVNSIE